MAELDPTGAEENDNPVIRKNIHRLLEIRKRDEDQMGSFDRLADRITQFAGSLPFLIGHLIVVGAWLIINARLLVGIRPWDPFPYVMLAMVSSVESIFLSTFLLISQNRQAMLADRRADLDLQIGLLTEHEVTRVLQMLHRLLEHQGLDSEWKDLEDLKKEVAPERVLLQIEEEAQGVKKSPP